MSDQPTEEQELANAAYVWRKKVQEDLLQAMRDLDIKDEASEYWFERYRRARRRELDAQEKASHPKPIDPSK